MSLLCWKTPVCFMSVGLHKTTILCFISTLLSGTLPLLTLEVGDMTKIQKRPAMTHFISQ